MKSKNLKLVDLRTIRSVNVGQEKGHVCMCLLICDHVSDVEFLSYTMNWTRHCSCMGWRCHYHRIEKIPRVSLESHLERIETFVHGRLMGTPNGILRFDHNQALFFLLSPSSDLLWR